MTNERKRNECKKRPLKTYNELRQIEKNETKEREKKKKKKNSISKPICYAKEEKKIDEKDGCAHAVYV